MISSILQFLYKIKGLAMSTINERLEKLKARTHKEYLLRFPELEKRQFKQKNRISNRSKRLELSATQKQCLICEADFDYENNSKNIHLDHCHKTGVIRGLLCNMCNLGLGFFEDNVSYLKAAIVYLEIDRTKV